MFFRLFLSILLAAVSSVVYAQLTGCVIDAVSEEPVPMATVSYHNGDWITKANENGTFIIERHEGWRLLVTSVGYKGQEIAVNARTPDRLVIRLEPESKSLDEVTILSKRRTRYKRKNNPAVDLMRKVIAAKKRTDLRQHPYFRYSSYQQIVAAINDLQQEDLKHGLFKNRPWLNDYLRISPQTGKLILPFSLEETVTDRLYRKSPAFEKEIVQAHEVSGLTDLFQTGDIFNVILKEYFTDIDIYDDQIRLLQNAFTSPIGRDAVQFYHYYITDTIDIGGIPCYQLDFIPGNPQDFGFRGQLFVLADSSYQVKRCDMTLPKVSQVNWVEGMKCIQEFTKLDNGEWVLSHDNLTVEMKVTEQTARGVVTRITRRSEYSFEELPDSLLHGNGAKEFANHYEQRDSAYWNRYRTKEQATNKETLVSLTENIEQLKFFPLFRFTARAILENFIETGSKIHPSKFDIGPVTSSISSNFYDGVRMRLGGQTTANLHPHAFLKGYYAYGAKSHEPYYDIQLIYTFNSPKYLPHEFPKKAVTIESMRDVALPSDKYLQADKDNVFSSAKIADVDKMFLYSRYLVRLDYEKRSGLQFFGEMKSERVTPVGNISFHTISGDDIDRQPYIKYTEATVGLRWAPKEVYLVTKQQRWPLNYDTPVFRLQHTTGLKGFAGGQYTYNYTELEFSKCFWLPLNLGSIDTQLKCGVQWNQVPFPLLIIPAANMSYFLNKEAFDLINNMEFLNDRYASIKIGWDLNGKFFNNIPLLKKLKCREYIGVKYLFGGLSDKNNPSMPGNSKSGILMKFPEGSSIMNGKRPYCELSLGVHNILNLIQIEYIRRLSYLELPTSNKHVVKFSIDFKF